MICLIKENKMRKKNYESILNAFKGYRKTIEEVIGVFNTQLAEHYTLRQYLDMHITDGDHIHFKDGSYIIAVAYQLPTYNKESFTEYRMKWDYCPVKTENKIVVDEQMTLLEKLNISGLYISEFDYVTQREYGSEIFKNYSLKTNTPCAAKHHYTNESILLRDDKGDIVFIGDVKFGMHHFLNLYIKCEHKWQIKENL